MRAPPPLGVLIVDDHAVVRAGLRLLLEREDGMTAVAEAANADEAVSSAAAHLPAIVLLDVTMPGESGIEAIPRLLEVSPQSKIIMLSMHDDPRYIRAAFAAGASGYVLKEAADTELTAAIRDVANGAAYLNPAFGARLIVAETQAEARAAADPLSQRELEVLQLLALGHTNQEIAARLFISVRTAETHRAHIMRKLRLGSRAELVRYVLAHRLLPAED